MCSHCKNLLDHISISSIKVNFSSIYITKWSKIIFTLWFLTFQMDTICIIKLDFENATQFDCGTLKKIKSMVWTRFCPPNLDAKIWDILRLPTLKVAINFRVLKMLPFDSHTLWPFHIGGVFALYFIQSMSQSFSWPNHERSIMFSFNLGRTFCCPSQEFILHQIKVATCLYKLNFYNILKSFTFLGSQTYMSMKYFFSIHNKLCRLRGESYECVFVHGSPTYHLGSKSH